MSICDPSLQPTRLLAGVARRRVGGPGVAGFESLEDAQKRRRLFSSLTCVLATAMSTSPQVYHRVLIVRTWTSNF